MKRSSDSKSCNEEKNWWEEKKTNDQNEIIIEDGEKILKTSGVLITSLFFATIVIILIIFIVLLSTFRSKSPETEKETAGMVTVTGQEEQETEIAKTETEKTTKMQQDKPETEEALALENNSWQQTIFGDTAKQALSGDLSLSGMTAGMAETANFRESDFLMSAAAFLSDQEIQSRKIKIEQALPCSSGGALVYLASLEGTDQALITLLYPDYPGKYQFLLLNEQAMDFFTEAIQEFQEAPETNQQEERLQVETNPVIAPPAASETQEQTEAPYDATRLSITGLPGTLDNYINNRYELQYSLYDYLYRNGHRQVTSAAVLDYSIDGDSRTATISFLLSDGETVTGVYAKDSNNYSFSTD